MAKKKSSRPSKGSFYGGSFALCDLGNGNLKIHNVRVNVIDIAGHTSSAEFIAHPVKIVPGGPKPPGTVPALKNGLQYEEDPTNPINTVANPCGGAMPELSLVVYHTFTPTTGPGIPQVLCEVIPARAGFCGSIRPCSIVLRKKKTRKKPAMKKAAKKKAVKKK